MRVFNFNDKLLVLVLGMGLCGLGCDSDSDEVTDGGASTRSDAGATEQTDATVDTEGLLYGNLTIELVAAKPKTESADAKAALTKCAGKFVDGPTPEPIVWTEMDAANGCSLRLPSAPFCSPSCKNSVCVADGMCQERPSAVLVGTINAEGLTDEAFDLEIVADNYQVVGSTLAYPPCSEGDDIAMHAAGGKFEAFSLSTKCIAPLSSPGEVAANPGEPIELTWTPPKDASHSRILVDVDLSHHGGSKGRINCDVADTGSLEIPATLVDALVALGYTGFPRLTLTRVSSASGTTPQSKNVTLLMQSSVEHEVAIPGFMSCTNDDQCPKGQTCGDKYFCD